MDLQQKQIDELADWLTVAEQRINSSEVIGSDLDTVRRQVEDHKVRFFPFFVLSTVKSKSRIVQNNSGL